MDNKITKKRLGGFLAYEWIAIILVAALITLGVGLIYIMTGVKPSPGQEYYFFLDQSIDGTPSDGIKKLFTLPYPENTFSYDVLEVRSESLSTDYNLLITRLAALQGDAIFTDTVIKDREDYEKYCRANSIIDGTATPIYSFEDFLDAANRYLEKFYDGEELNRDKVNEYFLIRMKGDNRFKSTEQKAKGLEQEIARIEKIKSCSTLLKKLLDYDTAQTEPENKIFYSYIRFEQSYKVEKDPNAKAEFEELYEKEKEKSGGGVRRYGLKIDKLNGNKHQPSDCFRKVADGKVDNVVLCFFDLLQRSNNQSIYDLQFESLSFLDTVIRDFSTFGDDL